MNNLRLYRMDLDYVNAKIRGFCFAYDLEEAGEIFGFKHGDKKPDTIIEELEIKHGIFSSITYDLYQKGHPLYKEPIG